MLTASFSLVRRPLLIGVWILLLTLAGYRYFPGHTYLQSDTQIYVPMLEHFWDPSVFEHDFMVQRPHMAFTIYDEVAIALRRLTGLGFREILTGQQFFFRALGLLGVFLIATSFKLSIRMALLVASIFGLGATIGGPTVLTVEYEPVPRAFALPLLILAVGLIAHGRDLSAGVAASLAFLYHPTTALAFWAVYFCLAIWPGGGFAAMRRRVLGLAPLLIAAVLLLVASRLQTGITESPEFLSRIPPWWEQILRLRSSYLWVSLWLPHWHWHYAILACLAGAAFFRLRRQMPADLGFFMAGLPLIGVLSVPLSWLLLEEWKLALAPQLQIARNILFLTAVVVVLGAVAAIREAQSSRRLEAFLWFSVVFALPLNDPIQWTFFTKLGDPASRRRLLLVVGLAAAGCLIAWAGSRRLRWTAPAWVALLFAPVCLYPTFGRIQNYPRLHTEEVTGLAQWARTSTDKRSLFLFADAGRDLTPGIFRATALRAVYVDWKSGGQGNYMPSVAREWWNRWRQVDGLRFKGKDLAPYARLGIDFVVLKPGRSPAGGQLVFENEGFQVYRVR